MSAFPIFPLPILPMLVERLGWVLTRSLWQCALIAVLVGVSEAANDSNGEIVGQLVDAVADDEKAPEMPDEKMASGLVPGSYGGCEQTMRIGSDGSISYSDAKGLCQMTLLDDDRLKIAFQYDREIWTDVTLPLVTGANAQLRARWSAEFDGRTYSATAIPFSTRGCVFRLEKRLDGKLIHGSLQFYAVQSRPARAEPAEPAAPIRHLEWRVDQSGSGVVAGRYTGASQVMQVSADGTVSYSDHPHGICHLAVLEDDRLAATFLDARGMPTEVTLPLLTTAAQVRASWSAEIDGHTLRATAIPFSDTVYVFRLEKLLGGKPIEGSQQFYAIDQKLRKAAPEETDAAAPLAWKSSEDRRKD